MIYLQLFISFLQIGAFSFGGGYAAMPLIQNQVVQVHPWLSQSEFVERFPELSLFYRLSSPLGSEMICIFPYFCPCEESAREIREFFIKHCSPLYQEVLRNPALLFLLSERRYSLWY